MEGFIVQMAIYFVIAHLLRIRLHRCQGAGGGLAVVSNVRIMLPS